MPHLNQLIESYKKKGFEALCVTAESDSAGKKKTQEFIDATDLKAAVGYLSKADNKTLMTSVGASGYPSSFLVNPKGKIVWKGHPSSLTSAIIEEHIGGARLGGAGGGITFEAELPKSYASIVKGLEKGKIGASLKKIEKALQNSRTSDSDKESLTSLRDEVRSFFDTAVEKAETAVNEDRPFDALAALAPLSKHYKGHELGKTAAAKMKAIKTNKSLKDEIEAGKRIAKALQLVEAGKTEKAKKALEIISSGYLKTTKEAARAKRLLATL